MERLALIEVLDHDGRVQHSVPVVRWPVTVGRALDCDVVLHDPHVAAHHATLDLVAEGVPALWLTVGASVNGVRWPERQLAAGASAPLPPGTIWQAGSSALRVRLAGEALAAETPLAHPARHHHTLLTAAAGCALLAWIAAQQWLENEPGSTWDKYLPVLIGTAAGLAAWSVLWGLGSKLFQRRFRLIPHLRAVLGFVLAGLLLDALLALGSFALSWPWLSHIRGWVEVALLAALLATHVVLLAPGRARAIAMIFGALCALSIGINAALTWHSSERVFGELYAATLPPPNLRLVDARPPAALLEDLRPLREVLDRRAKEDEDREAVDGF